MKTPALLMADIIGSKAIAMMPGGHAEIRDLCERNFTYLERILRLLADQTTCSFLHLPPEGDNVVFRLEADSPEGLANLALASTIAALSEGPAPGRFRYVLFRLDPLLSYQPRIKAFGDIAKQDIGKAHFIAVDRGLVSSASDREVIDWLRNAPSAEATIETPGEATTAVYVDFYCPIASNLSYPPLGFLRDSVIRASEPVPAPLESPYAIVAAPESDGPLTTTTSVVKQSLHQIRLMNERGELQLARRQLDLARISFRSCLAQYEAAGSLSGQAQMFTNLGRVDQAAGASTSAEANYEAALKLNRAAKSKRGEAIALTQLASLVEKTDPPRARTALLQAVDIEEELGDSLALIYATNSAGRLLRGLREPDLAAAMFDRAAKAALAIGQHGLACRNLGDLGTVLRDAGSIDKARDSYTRSLSIAQRWGLSYAEAIVRDNLGRLEATIGDDTAAEAHFLASLALDRAKGHAFGMAKSHANLGVLRWLAGEKVAACGDWRNADQLFRRATAQGGRIAEQSQGFLKKLEDIRERAEKTLRRAGRPGGKLNDLFF